MNIVKFHWKTYHGSLDKCCLSIQHSLHCKWAGHVQIHTVVRFTYGIFG